MRGGTGSPELKPKELVMDSINQQQTEENHADLTGNAAVEKIKDLAKGSCFFCTRASAGASEGTRPMSVQKVDDDGNLWFLSAIDSHKNLELAEDPTVDLYFQGSSHSDFLYLSGAATVSRDPKLIEELWMPLAKTWFTEGKDDPRITVIKVTPRSGYYWDTKHGHMVAGVKIMLGAVLGKTMDDSMEGRVELR